MNIPSDISRRIFVNRIAKGLLGCTVGSRLARAAETGVPIAGNPTADSVIYLFMDGGMSHLDTFDLRPDNPEIQGPLESIRTKIPGTHVTSKLPGLAAQMDKIAQIRSMTHTQGVHGQGKYHVRTGYDMGSRAIAHPGIGSWITKLAPRINEAMPPYIRVGDLGGHPANGFFSASYGPLPISSADAGLQNSALRDGMDTESFKESLDLVSKFDSKFRARHPGVGEVAAYSDLYTEAVRLMASKDLEGFDISKEPKEMRELYGKSGFGQGCLLARRLVERGVRYVEVDLGGWDTHTDNHVGVAGLCGTLDEGLSALLTDLSAKGMLERTLVVLTSEFGRSPNIDQYGGRNHNPFGFTSLLMGGGVNGGAVYGKTEIDGRGVSENPVTVHDFNSTIAHALGVDYSKMETAPGGQLFSIGGKDTAPEHGKPIKALFS